MIVFHQFMSKVYIVLILVIADPYGSQIPGANITWASFVSANDLPIHVTLKLTEPNLQALMIIDQLRSRAFAVAYRLRAA